jgi:hypothetical protein
VDVDVNVDVRVDVDVDPIAAAEAFNGLNATSTTAKPIARKAVFHPAALRVQRPG